MRLARAARALPRAARARRLGVLSTAGLPVVARVAFNYFDAERFASEHPDAAARPCYGDLDAGGPAVARRNRSRHAFDYFVPFERPVHDARPIERRVKLDEQGFAIGAAPTRMRREDFYSKAAVDAVYLDECAAFVMRETGASACLPFSYIVRNRARDDAAGYAENRPHNDHTLVSGPRRARELLAAGAARDAALDDHRFALINVWRRWDGGNDWPLACCSYESLDYARDMVAQDLVYEHRTGETYTVRRNPRHEYFTFPDMTMDEAILLKIFDSSETVARGSLHTGYRNADWPEDGPVRESMEVRCIALFAPEEIASRVTLRDPLAATNVQGKRVGPTGHDKGIYRER